MTIFTPIFLLVFLVLVVLFVRVFVLAVSKNGATAFRATIAPVSLAIVYTLTLVGVGLASRNTTLPIGWRKCFDDWCFAVTEVKRSGNHLDLRVETSNTGRRAQRPDSPKLSLVFDGQAFGLACPQLNDRLEGHSQHPFTITIQVPDTVQKVDLIATEGGGPSALIIGDENSPFHGKSVWRLVP